MPIDPTMAVSGGEWAIQAPVAPGAPGAADAAGAANQGGGFADLLTTSISSLTTAQTKAADASQAFAAGQDVDPTAVVLAVEKAQLSMQMASTMRTKGVEAYQDIFHTQV